jgi:hypothetical protein
MPPYITEGEVTTSTTEEVVIYHQPLSDANIKFFSLTPDKRLQMLRFACFACVDEPEFSTEESLLAHWSDNHSSEGIFQCPHCFFKSEKSQDGMEVLTVILQHMFTEHLVSIPNFVIRFQCPLQLCSQIFFSSEALSNHAAIHCLSPIVHEDTSELAWQMPVLPSHPVFTSHQCFSCSENLSSLAALLSHWLSVHCSHGSGAVQFDCPYCNLFSFECPSLFAINLNVLLASIWVVFGALGR